MLGHKFQLGKVNIVTNVPSQAILQEDALVIRILRQLEQESKVALVVMLVYFLQVSRDAAIFTFSVGYR
jgi:hypothetical protein